MTNLNRFALIMAEEEGIEHACPKCGREMEECPLFRTIGFWYCGACDIFRPKKEKHGNKGRKEDSEI